jgi:succinoglycan biosynthesis transport protein ExoP
MNNREISTATPQAAESFPYGTVADRAGDEFSLREIINIFVRRRWVILGSIILGALCAVLLAVFMKPVYQATATIEFNEENSGSIGSDLGGSAMSSLLGGEDLQTQLNTEVKVFASDALAMDVIRKLNLNAQPPFLDSKHPYVQLGSPGTESPSERTRLLKVFNSHLKVDLIGGTTLIEVGFRSHNPKQAAEVANAVIGSYQKMYLQSHFAAVSQASNWMASQLSDLKANVERSERRLTDFEKASGLLTLPAETALPTGGAAEGEQIVSPVIQKLEQLNAELTAAEADRIQKEAIFRLAAAGNPDVIRGLIASPLAQGSSLVEQGGRGQESDVLEGLQEKHSDLQVQMAQAEAIYGPNNRHLKDLQTQLNTVDAQMQDEMKKIVDRAGADLKVAQETESTIRAQLNAENAKADKLNDKSVQLSILSQEASSEKKLYEDLYTQLQEADVAAGMKATNITVVDPAFPTSRPVLPRPMLFIVLGVIAGAVLGIAAANMLERIDTSVISLPDVEELAGSAVIAVIPEFKQPLPREMGDDEKVSRATELEPSQSTAWILMHPSSAASEAFRSLRTGVLLSRPGGPPKVLLITSSVPAEGKSTVAVNLAIAMAQNGAKVIVVEADMRRPTLMRHFRLKGDSGLSSVLADAVSLDDAIIGGITSANLDVLPAGPVPPLPSELLGSAKFDSVLNELRARYDVVLIDSPPALMLTDAISIGSKADAVLWIVRAGRATRAHLARAAQQIHRNRLPLIGYVLNGLDRRIDPYGYGYYYGYNDKAYGVYHAKDSTTGD